MTTSTRPGSTLTPVSIMAAMRLSPSRVWARRTPRFVREEDLTEPYDTVILRSHIVEWRHGSDRVRRRLRPTRHARLWAWRRTAGGGHGGSAGGVFAGSIATPSGRRGPGCFGDRRWGSRAWMAARCRTSGARLGGVRGAVLDAAASRDDPVGAPDCGPLGRVL